MRDDCLVDVLQALRDRTASAPVRWSRDYERRLIARPPADGASDGLADRCSTPRAVPPEWVDYNGHVHESRYLQVFGDATDALLAPARHRRRVPARRRQLLHRRDASLPPAARRRAGDALEVTTQVLGVDEQAAACLPLAATRARRRAAGDGRADAVARRHGGGPSGAAAACSGAWRRWPRPMPRCPAGAGRPGDRHGEGSGFSLTPPRQGEPSGAACAGSA